MKRYALFGPAGNEEAFSSKYKSSVRAPEYLADMGLHAYEYQCTRGVNISGEKAAELGREAQKHGVVLSVHSPYFISLSSSDPVRMQKNAAYILATCLAALSMGADRVVVHCGGLMKQTRRQAMENTVAGLDETLRQMDERGVSGISLCMETMGKVNMLGDLDEVLYLCARDERLMPCIDFGHLNARTQGAVNGEEAFCAVLEQMEDTLGRERMQSFHAHFSKIEYATGGEVRHLTLEDRTFGPEFGPLGRLIAVRRLTPRIICESAGTQAADAAAMQREYRDAVSELRGEEA